MIARIVKVIVHTHHHGEILVLRGGGDDYFFRAGLDVALGLLAICEEAGGLDHDVNAEFLPRQLSRGGRLDHLDFGAVDHERLVVLMSDFALERALCGVVLEEIGQIVGRDEVPDGDHLDLVPYEALFHHCTICQSADSAETIDCYFYCHNKKKLIRYPEISGANRLSAIARWSTGFLVTNGIFGYTLVNLAKRLAKRLSDNGVLAA